ncbi:DUF2279 domain-containing protein [Spirosoma sp. BT702]|uniref:DUF2279 domain-containing protein n=1 Tax=Spirosoma profusum TaxID=2771354 RepID=A0A926Y463_9BACT|nr:DUF2279 domain-containing protein [Spirosoma profusum]MBD2702726.1 DUF2279 domain-containing protein [Spirosoma profusum]
MAIKFLLLCCSLTHFTTSYSSSIYPDSLPEKSVVQTDSLRRERLWAVGATSLLTLGSTYVYLERTWWNGKGVPFHFDEGRDLTYASGLDKVAHLAGGTFVAEAYYNAFRWAGVSTRKAEWLAFGSATFVELGIELKDAYSPTYGFSWRDVAFGTLGGFWPMAQNRSGFVRDAHWKVSYWQQTPKYFKARGIPIQRFSIDDYINQTYWFSFSPRHLAGKKTFPDWFQLSVGMGLEAETWSLNNDGLGGRHEWYVAPDINVVKLFKPRSTTAKMLVGLLKYIKIPMPTLQVAPTLRWYWLYF